VKNVCCIIPTIRDYPCIKKYAEAGGKKAFYLLVAEDFCDLRKMRSDLKDWGLDGEVLGQSDRDKWMKETGLNNFADLIPKRSHAETSFGLLWLQAHNEFDFGVFIDDDTVPISEDYFERHIQNLNFNGNINEVSSDKKWVNVLFQNFGRHKMYPRGYPYAAMQEKMSVETANVKNVVASQGLWTNVADLDAIRILMSGGLNGIPSIRATETDFKEDFVVKNENCLTICSMNLAFKREVIPAFYQLPMDDNEWKLGRFDDIWSGVFLKKICDILEKKIITGKPLCIHNKAPRSTFKDLLAEAPALEINENLWNILCSMNLKGDDYTTIYNEIGTLLQQGNWNYRNGDFLNYMGKMMQRWVECIDKISS